MDSVTIKNQFVSILKKNKYVLLVLAVGILLMLMPVTKEQTSSTLQPEETKAELDMSEQLAGILSQISGAGEVRVLLTEAEGKQIMYQTDEKSTDNSIQTDTVIISDGSRAEMGLIRQEIPPKYLGAIILCRGADKPQIRLAIVEAVSNATGLGTDQISVLKMK